MKRRLILAVVIVFAVVVGFLGWAYWGMNDSSKRKHETDTWVVIKDSKGDIMAVETTDPNTRDTLVDLHNNKTEMWIGGIVEQYDNYWEVRFHPDTIIIAQTTIEGAQYNIQGISGNMNYWINIWGKQTYVLAKVVERARW